MTKIAVARNIVFYASGVTVVSFTVCMCVCVCVCCACTSQRARLLPPANPVNFFRELDGRFWCYV